jgi:adenine-specific DNA-methyltransferase
VIREARKVSLAAGALTDKLEAQRQLKALESRRKEKRQRLFEAQDEVDEQRETLIEKIEAQLRQRHDVQVLFRVRWKLA